MTMKASARIHVPYDINGKNIDFTLEVENPNDEGAINELWRAISYTLGKLEGMEKEAEERAQTERRQALINKTLAELDKQLNAHPDPAELIKALKRVLNEPRAHQGGAA